jgi:carboxynorspermidine decarboxylase
LSAPLEAQISTLETPAFVVDLPHLRRNCELLAQVQERSGAKILLALKGFATWSCFDVVREYLVGIAASGPIEAQLGAEKFRREVHVYAPAYTSSDLAVCLPISNHIVFNSPSEWHRHRAQCEEFRRGDVSSQVAFGIRVNPEHSEVAVPLYDPCRPGSRLGATRAQLAEADLEGITGLHFHTLCELGADALERTLGAVEAKFGDLLRKVSWVNFGGGHHITREGYDIDLLVRLIRDFQAKYDLQVYLEPGEAIALDAGVLVASVLDVTENAGAGAILDVSATAHMPDVLEMPYRPQILGPSADPSGQSSPFTLAGEPGSLEVDCRLGGPTCLAGDMIGTYSFARPLVPGDRLVFRDMAIYTIVKTTMFNGVQHPAIAVCDTDGAVTVVRRFGYEDYRDRLS